MSELTWLTKCIAISVALALMEFQYHTKLGRLLARKFLHNTLRSAP